MQRKNIPKPTGKHSLTEQFVEILVELFALADDDFVDVAFGVDDDLRTVPEIPEIALYDIHLAERAQITRIYTVKGDALFLPVSLNDGNVFRQISESIAGETTCVGGKDRRRKDDRLSGGAI